jgi:monothiol glutaredoxin
MARPVLEESRIHPAIRERVSHQHGDTLAQVQKALSQHAVVVVGMRFNPVCGRARRALSAVGVAHQYLEFGSYFSQWRRRNVLKMWTGWPTFPMVFVKGQLLGGGDDLERLIKSGELLPLVTG